MSVPTTRVRLCLSTDVALGGWGARSRASSAHLHGLPTCHAHQGRTSRRRSHDRVQAAVARQGPVTRLVRRRTAASLLPRDRSFENDRAGHATPLLPQLHSTRRGIILRQTADRDASQINRAGSTPDRRSPARCRPPAHDVRRVASCMRPERHAPSRRCDDRF